MSSINSFDVEKFFFGTKSDRVALVADKSHRQFRAPPLELARSPYRLQLDDVLPNRCKIARETKRLVFHTVGDTGGINGTGAQQNVADHMARQIHTAESNEQALFFYHLGDVIYYNGEDADYHDQFYFPYQHYPAPIFAIPGNHDGDTLAAETTLGPFYWHFCAPTPVAASEAGHSGRPRMTQPNCYWVLDAPLLTIIGLYSNVSGELDDPDDGSTTQRDWLMEQLQRAPVDKALVLAVHHPLFSLGKHGGTKLVRKAIESAIEETDRWPDAILTGHDHCYQRFTYMRKDRQIPILVVGAGGFATYDDLTRVDENGELPKHVTLAAYEDRRPGFMRMTVTDKTITGEYFTVPKAGREQKPEKLRDEFSVDLKSHRVIKP